MIRTALVTGANRGIGFEVCRELGRLGHRVVLTARDSERGENSAARLKTDGIDVRFEVLDVAVDDSVDACAVRLRSAGLAVDILVNNAAIYPEETFLPSPKHSLRDTMETNFFGAARTCRAFLPGMIERGWGRVVNVSSGCGSFASGLRCHAAYSISKAALNALTVKLASEIEGDVKINAANPGWVQTRMGGARAPKSVEQGADTIVWLATLPKGGPNGGFFSERKPVPW